MEKYSFGKVDEKALVTNFAKALKDEEFVKVVNELDVSDNIKYRYTSSLKEIALINKTCQDCKGLANCPYEIKGLKKIAVAKDNIINFMYKNCEYKDKDEQDKEYLVNVSIYKMPKEIREASFKNIYKDDSSRLETIKYLKKFYDNYKRDKFIKGLYLYGNFGCGKSYLVAALFNELAKKNIPSTIIYFPEFLRSLKTSFNDVDSNYEDRFNEVKEANLLLLDDIGAEKLTDWARDEVLGIILQYRMEEHLPTFFTSNLSLKDLEKHLQIRDSSDEKIKARRIIERIKFLTEEMEMISINRRV